MDVVTARYFPALAANDPAWAARFTGKHLVITPNDDPAWDTFNAQPAVLHPEVKYKGKGYRLVYGDKFARLEREGCAPIELRPHGRYAYTLHRTLKGRESQLDGFFVESPSRLVYTLR